MKNIKSILKKNQFIINFYNKFRTLFFRKHNYRNMAVSDYTHKRKIKFVVEDNQQQRLVYIPKMINGIEKEEVLYYDYEPIFSTIIPNCYVFGCNESFVTRGICLNERFRLPFIDHVYLLSPGGNENTNNRDKSLFVYDKLHLTKIKEGIILFGEAPFNYYHFCFDILGKMAYINHNKNINDIPLLVDSCIMSIPTMLQLLNLVNVNKHPIFFLKSNKRYKVKKLLYYSPPQWSFVMPNNSFTKEVDYNTTYRFAKNEEVIKMYRSLIPFALSRCKNNYSKYVFISRGPNKRLRNEEEAYNNCRQFGFEYIYLPNYNILEQIKIFNNAEIIIADSGAACTNIMYCNKGCHFVMFSANDLRPYYYSTLAYLVGIDFVLYNSNGLWANNDRSIDIPAFIEYLKQRFDF